MTRLRGGIPAEGESALRREARAILDTALAAVDPVVAVERCLTVRRRRLQVAGEIVAGTGRLLVAAVGKAAVPMARAAAERLDGIAFDGVIVSPGPAKVSGFTAYAAGHPVPDAVGERAARDLEARAGALGREDVLLLLLSGGASALLPAPVAGVSLREKATLTRRLLASGADIHELNVVRKHLSRLKGGGLARAASPARVIGLALSDVVGDDVGTIGSGLAAPDPSTYAEAVAILKRRGLWRGASAGVRRHLSAGTAGRRDETPKAGDPLFRGVRTTVIGGGRQAVEAAARDARQRGFRTIVLTTRLVGEAREVAQVLAAILRECVTSGRPTAPPVCLLAGGETTVTVRGPGRGGRNQELALACVSALSAFPSPAVVASLGTDGIDGVTGAAGGIVDRGSLERGRRQGRNPQDHLDRNDSHAYLEAAGDLIVTGPTGTNVGDLVVLLARP